jgi:Ca-activated chloride channel family protein
MTLAFTIVVTAVLALGNRPCEVLNIASSQEKSALLMQIADEYNRTGPTVDGRCARVNVVYKASGEAQDALARGWDPGRDGTSPDVWTPAASSWTALLNYVRAARKAAPLLPDETPPSIVQSPYVIAMHKEMAEALGWPVASIGWRTILELARDPAGWKTKGRPEWGPFRLGKTNPLVSTSGLHALIGTYYATTASSSRAPVVSDLSDPKVLDFVRGVESSVVHYGDTVRTFLENLLEADTLGTALSYVSAVAMEEKQVWNYNHGNPRSDPIPAVTDLPPGKTLVAIYPSEGALIADHPYAVLNAAWVTDAKRKLAEAFLAHLLTPRVQDQFKEVAFRDYRGNPGSQISPANGLLPDQPALKFTSLAPVVIEGIRRSWSDLRRKARLVVAIDVSESMGDRVDLLHTKLDLVKSATTALDQLHANDEVSLWTFSTGMAGGATYREVIPMSRMGERGGDIRSAIQQLTPIRGGRTPLYEVTKAAVGSVSKGFAADRINAVLLLTDAGNEDPVDAGISALTILQRELRSQPVERPVRVFTVGYGANAADTDVLQKIARASRGAYYPATPDSIQNVLKEVISNF